MKMALSEEQTTKQNYFSLTQQSNTYFLCGSHFHKPIKFIDGGSAVKLALGPASAQVCHWQLHALEVPTTQVPLL